MIEDIALLALIAIGMMTVGVGFIVIVRKTMPTPEEKARLARKRREKIEADAWEARMRGLGGGEKR